MDHLASKHNEVLQLLMVAADGDCSQEDLTRLNEMLRDDSELRRRVARSLQDEAILREKVRTLHVARMFDDSSVLGEVAELPRPRLTARPKYAKIAAAFLSGCALCALLLAAFGVFRTEKNSITSHAPTAPGRVDRGTLRIEKSSAGHVAFLTHAVDVQWSRKDFAVRPGATLPPGQLQFDEGLIQLEFFGGATVILEGPADFDLVSASEAFCRRGRLNAEVAPEARGFVVGSANMTVVDKGTQFAMHVDADSGGGVHVMEGEVVLKPKTTAVSGPDARTITGGMAIEFEADGVLRQRDADRGAFIGSEEVLRRNSIQQQDRYARWKTQSERIKASDDAILYYDFEGQQPWDRRLPSRVAGDSRLLDGAIVGAQWSDGRWPGKGALDFKRTNDRVRFNLPGEFESLTFFAWVRIGGLDRWLNSLVLTDGWEPGEVHWQMSELGELAISVSERSGAPSEESENRSHSYGNIYTSPRVIGPEDLGRWVFLTSVIDGERGLVTHYLDGRAVSSHAMHVIRPLKIGAAEIGNWRPSPGDQYWLIRSLNGRVDEIGICKRALAADDIEQFYNAGTPYQ